MPKLTVTKKIRKPYISVNKLAEYMQASAMRRREIVKTLKQDSDFTKLYYFDFKQVFPKYMESNYDDSILDKVIASVGKKKGLTKWDQNDIANTIIALKSLKDSSLPDLSGYEVVFNLEKLDSIKLGGVLVTLKPEIYLRHKTSKKIGALKSHLSKTEKHRLNTDGMGYAATLLKYGFLEYGYKESEIDKNSCISIDVFSKSYNTAPTAFRRSISALEASCEEIALRWASI